MKLRQCTSCTTNGSIEADFPLLSTARVVIPSSTPKTTGTLHHAVDPLSANIISSPDSRQPTSSLTSIPSSSAFAGSTQEQHDGENPISDTAGTSDAEVPAEKSIVPPGAVGDTDTLERPPKEPEKQINAQALEDSSDTSSNDDDEIEEEDDKDEDEAPGIDADDMWRLLLPSPPGTGAQGHAGDGDANASTTVSAREKAQTQAPEPVQASHPVAAPPLNDMAESTTTPSARTALAVSPATSQDAPVAEDIIVPVEGGNVNRALAAALAFMASKSSPATDSGSVGEDLPIVDAVQDDANVAQDGGENDQDGTNAAEMILERTLLKDSVQNVQTLPAEESASVHDNATIAITPASTSGKASPTRHTQFPAEAGPSSVSTGQRETPTTTKRRKKKKLSKVILPTDEDSGSGEDALPRRPSKPKSKRDIPESPVNAEAGPSSILDWRETANGPPSAQRKPNRTMQTARNPPGMKAQTKQLAPTASRRPPVPPNADAVDKDSSTAEAGLSYSHATQRTQGPRATGPNKPSVTARKTFNPGAPRQQIATRPLQAPISLGEGVLHDDTRAAQARPSVPRIPSPSYTVPSQQASSPVEREQCECRSSPANRDSPPPTPRSGRARQPPKDDLSPPELAERHSQAAGNHNPQEDRSPPQRGRGRPRSRGRGRGRGMGHGSQAAARSGREEEVASDLDEEQIRQEIAASQAEGSQALPLNLDLDEEMAKAIEASLHVAGMLTYEQQLEIAIAESKRTHRKRRAGKMEQGELEDSDED